MIEAEPFEVPGNETPIVITASIGAATATNPAETAEALLARADTALYQAKNGGRNQARLAEEPKAAAPTASPTAAAGGT